MSLQFQATEAGKIKAAQLCCEADGIWVSLQKAEKRKEEACLPAELRYRSVGGVPFLDNQYTVYGEVVDGIEVVDAIQKVKTNKQDRPLENIVIKSMELVE